MLETEPGSGSDPDSDADSVADAESGVREPEVVVGSENGQTRRARRRRHRGVRLDPETCYRALVSRDARFDGTFFVAVRTTGVYCRPVCTARTPRRDRCAFYDPAVLAERDGFRACFTCRPELAPGSARVDSVSRLVAAAIARIEAGALNDGSIEQLASELGVTARHLRRAFASELGVTPVALAQSRRLSLAKQLIQDGSIGLAEVAFASGFRSVRRFNAAFRERFGRAPSELRRARAASDDRIVIRLDYRPPLDWSALLAFLGPRAVPSIERVDGDRYERTVRVGARTGWVAVAPDPARAALRAEIAPELAPELMAVVARLRRMLDLDAHPDAVGAHLAQDPRLAPLVEARPGLRVPGAFDGFELLVRAILGQQVSVRAATTLASRLAARFGDEVEAPSLERVFPAPEAVASAGEDALASIGLPRARARAIAAAARAFADGSIRVEPGADAEAAMGALRALDGVGEWTASYVAMRALGWPDAFPAGDLVLRRAIGASSPRELAREAERWRPWRAYAALHLWTDASRKEEG